MSVVGHQNHDTAQKEVSADEVPIGDSSTHQRLGILREHLKITRIKEKCFSAAEIYEESLEACRSNNAPAVHFCDLNLEEHLTTLQNPGRFGCKNNAGPSLCEALTYFLFNLIVSAVQPAGECSTTQQGPGQSPRLAPRCLSRCRQLVDSFCHCFCPPAL